MGEAQKAALFSNTADGLRGAQQFIQVRHIRNCYKADPDYGRGVAGALGLSMDIVRDYEGYEMKPLTEI